MDNNYENEEIKEEMSADSKSLLKDVVAKQKSDNDDKKTDKKDKKKDKNKKEKKKFNAKKLKHGTMATVLTCVFVAVLVLINVVTTMLFDKYPITIDLTSDKIYSVSDESEEYVKNVSVDVQVTVFADEDTFTNYSAYNKQAVELLKNYCKLNHHITYRFMDIDSNPDVVREYSDSISQFDIVFETNTEVDGEKVQRTKLVTPVDLVNFSDAYTSEFLSYYQQQGVTEQDLIDNYGALNFVSYMSQYGYIESSNAEQAYTSALMTVTDPNPIYVTFLTGRSEVTELTYFKTLLTANGYNVNSVDITKEDIPDDTSVIVVPAPQTDYLDTEVTKISDFLNNGDNLGKQLIYVASYSQSSTPNLDEFLAEYGIDIGEGVICETYSGDYYNYPCITTATDLSDSFKQDVVTENPVIASEFCRPVNVLFDEQGMQSTEQYIMSTQNAYTANIEVANSDIKIGDKLTSGTQCYFAVGSKAKFLNDSEGTTVYSNILAFGSEYLLNDNILSAEQYQNREYFLSVLNGITHKTDGVTITPKTIAGNIFDITELQKSVLKYTFCLGVPVIVLIIGIVVWARRKNK